jgi:hypothetical protein
MALHIYHNLDLGFGKTLPSQPRWVIIQGYTSNYTFLQTEVPQCLYPAYLIQQVSYVLFFCFIFFLAVDVDDSEPFSLTSLTTPALAL